MASSSGRRRVSSLRLCSRSTRSEAGGKASAESGAVTQRAASDVRLNPHLHLVFLDGAYREVGSELVWEVLGHLQTREVGEVLERAVRRMERYLRRRGKLAVDATDENEEATLGAAAMRAVSVKTSRIDERWEELGRLRVEGTLYRVTPTRSGEIIERPLAKRRWIVPVLVLAAVASILVFRSIARSRVSMRIDPYGAPIDRPASSAAVRLSEYGLSTDLPATPLYLRAPAFTAVGRYTLGRGIVPFTEDEGGELPAWYADVTVSGARVELASPRPVAHSAEKSSVFVALVALKDPLSGSTRAQPPPRLAIGFEGGDPRSDVADSIASWMSGPKNSSVRLTWMTMPGEAIPWLIVIGFAGIACALLWRARTVVYIDGPTLSIESRTFASRTSRIPRGEIRTVVIDARPLGPLVFARPAIVTSGGARIVVGASVLSDLEAGDLARRIRELLA